MNILIKKGRMKGTVVAPPSKSLAHRRLIATALSERGIVENISLSDDIVATISCLKELGTNIKMGKNNIEIVSRHITKGDKQFNANESGSTLRFLIPIALSMYDHFTFKGSPKLIERGIGEYERLFRYKGIEITKTSDSITFNGRLRPGTFNVYGKTSSQFISGLLFALPLLDGNSVLNVIPPVESSSYIDLTLQVLKEHNVSVLRLDNSFYIKGGQSYLSGLTKYVEGDYSNASVFLAFNKLGSKVTVNGLNKYSLQGDKMADEYLEELKKGYQTIDLENTIDLGPVLMVYAALNHGGRFIHTERLKYKESDRALSIKEELAKVGVDVEVLKDEVRVSSSITPNDEVVFDSHNDHRIAMALSLLSSLMDVRILDASCIRKSFPNFFKELGRLGLEVSEYE